MKCKHFEGNIQKFRIVTNGISYGACPKAEDEVEQHLTVTKDGRVWFAGYNYGNGYGKYVKARMLQFKLSEEEVKTIFEAFQNYFPTEFAPCFVTDIGSWEMVITTDDGVTHEFRSAFGSKMEYRGKSLSEIVEEILGIEDLWGFGDIESHDDYNYIYCSVYYSGGCKSYHYIADEDDIEVGDYVLVPVGANGKETVAKVVEKKYFCVDDVPFPVEKTKHIIRKCEMKDLLAKLDGQVLGKGLNSNPQQSGE